MYGQEKSSYKLSFANYSKMLMACLWVLALSALSMCCLLGNEWINKAITPLSYERRALEISFETSVPVDISCTYPILRGNTTVVAHVNEQLQTEAEKRFAHYLQGELSSYEEWEDGCRLNYELLPVYQAPNLISILGIDHQGRGCHGCTYYEGITFWQNGSSIVSLTLDDLFVKESGYQQFLLQYCESAFTSSGDGYYSWRCEYLPKLCLKDLDIFVLTDKGLMIVFRAYVVGGWADGPHTITIPYVNLKMFIDCNGPLKDFVLDVF